MNINRVGSTASRRGTADWFTGSVWIEELAGDPGSSQVRVFRVSFEPGARTAWHTHPVGQLLHILAGVCRVQRDGEKPTEVYPGDTVWFEPGERHWHGAAPGAVMVHLAIQQADASGSHVTWLEHVTEADYNRARA